MVGEPPKEISAFYHFQVLIYGENMYFSQKIVEKNSLNFFEIDHIRCIFAQKFDSRCQQLFFVILIADSPFV